MSDPKLQALQDLARKAQRADTAREARELATQLRIATEEFVRERRAADPTLASALPDRRSFE